MGPHSFLLAFLINYFPVENEWGRVQSDEWSFFYEVTETYIYEHFSFALYIYFTLLI